MYRPGMRQLVATKWFWLAVYLGAVLAPLVVLFGASTPGKLGFWWDVGIGLGFSGLVMMSIQFLITARFRAATGPFGLDLIYYYHRYLAYVLTVVVLAHPALLLLRDPSLWTALDPRTAPWPLTAGVVSLALLLVLIINSAGRQRLRIPYDAWRRAHLVLAVAAVAAAFLHLKGIGYYSGTMVARGLWTVIGISLLLAVLKVHVWRPWRMLHDPYEVVSVRREAGDTWILSVASKKPPGLTFEPGQFVWLTVRSSPFAMSAHPFSIASSPQPGGRLEFAIKERGDFTRSIGGVEPGETVYVEGPYGSFSIDRHPDAAGYVFLAGGIGLAPLLSMVRTLADRQDRRAHVLIVCNSRWDRIPLRDELQALEQRLNLRVVHVLEDPPEGWTGERGWIQREMLARYLPADPARCEYFLCGPVPMTRIAERSWRALGVPAARLHTELFDLA